MKGAVDELIGNDEVGGLVFFLERADGGDGDDALDAELFEGVDVGAEVQLRGQDTMDKISAHSLTIDGDVFMESIRLIDQR